MNEKNYITTTELEKLTIWGILKGYLVSLFRDFILIIFTSGIISGWSMEDIHYYIDMICCSICFVYETMLLIINLKKYLKRKNNKEKFRQIFDYEEALMKIAQNCKESHQSLVDKHNTDGVTSRQMIAAIEDNMRTCKKLKVKAQELGDYEGDSSLKDVIIDLLSSETDYLEMFLITQRVNIDNLVDTDMTIYNLKQKLNQLEDKLDLLDDKFNAIDKARNVFAKKHGW